MTVGEVKSLQPQGQKTGAPSNVNFRGISKGGHPKLAANAPPALVAATLQCSPFREKVHLSRRKR